MEAGDRLTAALEEIRQRRAITQELCGDGSEYINRLYRSAEDVPWLLRALDAVLALHREFRIYDECGHTHTEEDLEAGAAIQTADMVTCQDAYAYSICAECCRDGWGQAEECASEHDHALCWPCPTHGAITRELLGEGNGDA